MSDAPTVLLLHGVQSSRATWWRVGQDLTDLGWRVLAVDLLGYGGRVAPRSATVETMANDVLTQVHGQRVDLIVGYALGAIVGLELVGLRTGRVRGIALEDPPGANGSLDLGALAARLEAAVARSRADPGAEVAGLLEAHPLWATDDARRLVESRRRLDIEHVGAFLRANRWNLPELVAASPVPVHLIAAARASESALLEPDRGTLLSTLPRERVSCIAGGHTLHRDRPALWLNAVLTFAESLGLRASEPGGASVLSPGG
jgi:pimeloyl-ACP methyl ester carboxylesterase